jgi:hypothetical protein
MNLWLGLSGTTGFGDPYEGKNPCYIDMKLQDGFFGHIVSLTIK